MRVGNDDVGAREECGCGALILVGGPGLTLIVRDNNIYVRYVRIVKVEPVCQDRVEIGIIGYVEVADRDDTAVVARLEEDVVEQVASGDDQDDTEDIEIPCVGKVVLPLGAGLSEELFTVLSDLESLFPAVAAAGRDVVCGRQVGEFLAVVALFTSIAF